MCHPIAPADVAIVRALADAAEAADGHPSLGDAVWRDLKSQSEHTTLFVATADEQPVGALHTMALDDGSITAGVVVLPEHREAGVAAALLDAALAANHDARRAVLWAFGADERADAFATGRGFKSERELWQMRVPLPLAEETRWPPGITTRPFVIGQDEAAWVAVNNRAFVHDPDQGGWSEDNLRRLEAESWFDPVGFLLAIDDRGLAGFCWTKVHASVPPNEPDALGEIYVIGVDPDRQGSGLGRALVVGGLASLHERGTPVGMLFVDASNAPAVALYRALGFTTTRVDRAYALDIA
ncbi:MAG: mycothiol synthase [Acidimicrobiia bacterium]|nr:mycothiol synthase [Acidimicrobiia bacterium]